MCTDTAPLVGAFLVLSWRIVWPQRLESIHWFASLYFGSSSNVATFGGS